MFKIIMLFAVTQLFAVITGSVLLIQLGTWLSILSALLILAGYFVVSILIVMFVSYIDKNVPKKEKKEENV